MSDSSHSTPEPISASVKLDVTAELTRTVIVADTSGAKSTGRNAKKTRAPKTTTTTKTKQFFIELCEDVDGYTQLMKTILDKHGESKYKERINAKVPFTFKYFFTGSPKRSALDVDTFEEYRDLIQGVRVGEPKNPIKLSIIVRLEDVEQAIIQSKKKTLADTQGTDSETEDNDDELHVGRIQERDLDSLEVALAENRLQLEKKYANPNGQPGFTFEYDENYRLSLTPAMIKEWALAMKDNEATIHDPPYTAAFDPQNRRPALHPRRAARLQAVAAAAAPNPAANDSGAVAQLATAVVELAKAAFSSFPIAPTTPRRKHVASSLPSGRSPSHSHDPTASPTRHPPHSPNDTLRFLKHMKDNHGVTAAPQYVEGLQSKGYGPDILHQVPVEELTGFDVGATPGDALRLRNAAQEWWNTRGKRTREDVEHDADFSRHVKKRCSLGDFDDDVPVAHHKPSEWYYRGTFPNGTMQHWRGGPLVRGDRQAADDHIQYKDPATDDWYPVPPGYYAPLPGDFYDDNGELWRRDAMV